MKLFLPRARIRSLNLSAAQPERRDSELRDPEHRDPARAAVTPAVRPSRSLPLRAQASPPPARPVPAPGRKTPVRGRRGRRAGQGPRSRRRPKNCSGGSPTFCAGPTPRPPSPSACSPRPAAARAARINWLTATLAAADAPIVALRAADLADEPERALAAALYRALAPRHGPFAQEAAREAPHFGADPGAIARAARDEPRRQAPQADRGKAGPVRFGNAARRPQGHIAVRDAGNPRRYLRAENPQRLRAAPAPLRLFRRAPGRVQGSHPRPQRIGRTRQPRAGLAARALRLQGPDAPAAAVRR